MKLVFAVVSNSDANHLVEALIKEHQPVTKLVTSGGFLKRKNVTLMLGVEEANLEHVLAVIKANCKSRTEMMPVTGRASEASVYTTHSISIPIGGATIFVVDVEKFEKV